MSQAPTEALRALWIRAVALHGGAVNNADANKLNMKMALLGGEGSATSTATRVYHSYIGWCLGSGTCRSSCSGVGQVGEVRSITKNLREEEDDANENVDHVRNDKSYHVNSGALPEAARVVFDTVDCEGKVEEEKGNPG